MIVQAAVNLDFTKVVPSAEFVEEDDEETRLVREMVEEARRYVTSFRWCDAVRADYVGIASKRRSWRSTPRTSKDQ